MMHCLLSLVSPMSLVRVWKLQTGWENCNYQPTNQRQETSETPAKCLQLSTARNHTRRKFGNRRQDNTSTPVSGVSDVYGS